MDFKEFKCGENDEGRRLDKVLKIFLPDMNLSLLYKNIRNGLIKVNKKKQKENYHIEKGDCIQIAAFLLEDKNESLEDHRNTLNIKDLIIFQNEHILILNKPYDIKVHGDKNSLDEAVKAYYKKEFSDNSISFTPGPLHRLDRKTTGLLAFSLSLKGARWFSENIQDHTITKIYSGIVQGKLETTEKWIDFIEKEEPANEKNFHKVQVSEKDGKKAVTSATPLKFGKFRRTEITLVQYNIETGRTHQIRSQSAAHGYPLLGDTAYGGLQNTGLKQDFYLHAEKLIFPEDNPLGLPSEIICKPDYNFLFV